jgi:hypothetical protein
MAVVIAYRKEQGIALVPDPTFVTFVAKIQKAKTRKDKGYFILRTTVPKGIAEKMSAQPGDYLLFKTKKAEWYHMLNWKEMGETWQMLPPEIRSRAILDGLPCPGATSQMGMSREALEALGSASPTATLVASPQQTVQYNLT